MYVTNWGHQKHISTYNLQSRLIFESIKTKKSLTLFFKIHLPQQNKDNNYLLLDYYAGWNSHGYFRFNRKVAPANHDSLVTFAGQPSSAPTLRR